MPLDLAVQQQIINSIASSPNRSLSLTIGHVGSTVADNLLFLQEAGVAGLIVGPPDEDGNRHALATFTTDGQAFVNDPFGQEVILKTRIQEKIHQLPDLTDGQRQRIRHALEKLPRDSPTHVTLRLVDLGLGRDVEAVRAVLEYLRKL